MGLMRGMKLFSYHVRPLSCHQGKARDNSGEKRNAEINENALRNVADGNVDHHASQAKPQRQLGDEDPGVDGVEEHLKN